MPTSYLDIPAGTLIHLEKTGGLPRSVHVFDEDSILAINAALIAGRPLLVRGEPGTGKSQLARAAAQALGRAFVPHAVDGRTETRDLLWSVDAVARLAEAQLMGARHGVDHEELRRRIDIIEFVQPGALWWAFDWTSAREQAKRSGLSEPFTPEGWTPDRGAVVLVDEIDKADAVVPNSLLDAFGHGRFDVPGRGCVEISDTRPTPLVMITTNEEHALPDAFLRRCLVLHLALPVEFEALQQVLIARGRAHFPECVEPVLQRAAELLARDREEFRRQDLAPPGLAEYIDLVRAVTTHPKVNAQQDQLVLLERIAKFALRKHPPEPGRPEPER